MANRPDLRAVFCFTKNFSNLHPNPYVMVYYGDVHPGNYFALDGKRIEITREHYLDLPELCEHLIPLRIAHQKLYVLGFDKIYATGAYVKSYGSIPVYLREGKNKYWIVQLGNISTLRTIEYIHELQNVWYWFFAEPLQRPADKPRPSLEKSNIIVTHKKLYRQEDRGPVFDGYKPLPVDPFYLTWDCQFIFCTKPIAIWQTTPDNALFEYGRRGWGLKLLAGKAATGMINQVSTWLSAELRKIPHYDI